MKFGHGLLIDDEDHDMIWQRTEPFLRLFKLERDQTFFQYFFENYL